MHLSCWLIAMVNGVFNGPGCGPSGDVMVFQNLVVRGCGNVDYPYLLRTLCDIDAPAFQ